MTKTYRIWQPVGKSGIKSSSIESETMTFKRTSTGLTVKFSNKRKADGVIALIDITKDKTKKL